MERRGRWRLKRGHGFLSFTRCLYVYLQDVHKDESKEARGAWRVDYTLPAGVAFVPRDDKD